MRPIHAPCLLAALILAGPAPAQTTDAAPPAAFARPPAPGALIDIGGRRLHILCKGEGEGPVVIFEAGLSQWTADSTYGPAQTLIAPTSKACTYDRAGLGWSDPAPGPRTHGAMVEDLHRLLAAADIPPPYILVGHSMGGLIARLYVQTYPGEVAGVVLADASSEANFRPEAAASRAAALAEIDAALANATPGQPVVALPAGTPADVVMAFTPEILRAVRGEHEAVGRAAADLIPSGAYGDLGATPLAVVRRGRTETPVSELDIWWRTAQEALPALSSDSVLIVAENSGHVIPYDEPRVIADAVRWVAERAAAAGR